MKIKLEKFIKSIDPSLLGLEQILFQNIKKLQEGFMNENYFCQISGKSFLIRLSKNSDGFYGNKLSFEFKILQNLDQYNITPKAILYGKLGNRDILIEEFVDGKQEFTFKKEINQKIANTIKILQKINLELDFIPKINVLQNYKKKYITWLNYSKNDFLKSNLEEGLKNIDKNLHFYEKDEFILCHNDLRLDNSIIKEDSAYLIDLEGMTYGNKYVDIAGYYSGNLFSEKFGYSYVFSESDLIDRCNMFSEDIKNTNKVFFIVYLQFFSDLCWLDNYLNQYGDDKKLGMLFEKNIELFKNNIQKLYKG